MFNVKIWYHFLDFRLSQGSVATYCRQGGNLCYIYTADFYYEPPGEKILKIGPHLPKLLSNIKGLNFLEHGVFVPPAPCVVPLLACVRGPGAFKPMSNGPGRGASANTLVQWQWCWHYQQQWYSNADTTSDSDTSVLTLSARMPVTQCPVTVVLTLSATMIQ